MAVSVPTIFKGSDPMTIVRSMGDTGDHLDHFLRTEDFPVLRRRLAGDKDYFKRLIVADLHNVHPLDAGMIGQVLQKTRDIQVRSTDDLHLLLSFTIQQGEPSSEVRRRMRDLFLCSNIPKDLFREFRGLLETYVIAGDDAEGFNECADMETCHLRTITIRRMLPIFHVRMDQLHRRVIAELGEV